MRQPKKLSWPLWAPTNWVRTMLNAAVMNPNLQKCKSPHHWRHSGSALSRYNKGPDHNNLAGPLHRLSTFWSVAQKHSEHPGPSGPTWLAPTFGMLERCHFSPGLSGLSHDRGKLSTDWHPSPAPFSTYPTLCSGSWPPPGLDFSLPKVFEGVLRISCSGKRVPQS